MLKQLALTTALIASFGTAHAYQAEINAGKLNKSEILTATPVVSTVMWDESQMYLCTRQK